MKAGGYIATASVIPTEDSVLPGERLNFVIPSEHVSASRGTFCFPLRTPASPVVCSSFKNQKSKTKNFPLVCLLLALLTAFSTPARAQSPGEYDVKAAYLYNFGKFVRWPESATKGPQFLICVLGDDPFNGTLQSTVAGEMVNGKPAVVEHLTSARNASPCNILFISRSERNRVRHILDSIDIGGTLTVSDISGFAEEGGMIQFVNEDGRIRFTINLPAAERAGLNMSSELLKVASAVKGHP